MDDRASSAGFSAVELLMVMTVMVTVAAMAVPMMGNMLANARIGGDARGVSNATAMAKMRAAAAFSFARLYADLGARTYRVQVWNKTGTPGWVTEGSTQLLSPNVSFGFGSIAAAPPNTQTTIGQAALCRDDAGADIPGTACVVFNSRGLPVDAAGSPIGTGAYYLRDTTAVFAITVSATGMVRLWRAPLTGTAVWALQ